MWNERTASEATKGKAQGAWSATRVTIDSRDVQKGDLFVAIQGERFDGHAFVNDALAKGASAAIVSKVEDANAPLLIVKDTMQALRDLGNHARKQSKAKIIGVTGSVGKTGTKEMLALVLSALGKTYATKGNLNNHIGVPLSLANMPAETQFAVFEMGMNHAGEITALTKMVQPHVSVITTIEPAHLEFFDSVEAIADAKAEIFLGMDADGIAVLNRDNPYFARLANAAKKSGIRNILSFGAHDEADCRLINYRATALGSEIEAVIDGTPMHYRSGAIGHHWAVISLSVLAVIEALSADLPAAAASLAQFHEPEGRGKISRIGDITLIDDSYNASPASMRAAFAKLRDIVQPSGARSIAVLGDMLELGKDAAHLHAELRNFIEEYQIDTVYTAGPLMQHLHKALPAAVRGAHAANAAELALLLINALRPGNVVLVKGSHGSRMSDVVKALQSLQQPTGKGKENAV